MAERQILPITASEMDVFKNFKELEKEQVDIVINHSFSRTLQCWPLRLSNKINNKLKFMDSDKQADVLKTIFRL